MNSFAKRLKSDAAWNAFQPVVPVLIEAAQIVVDSVKAMVSDPYYESPRSLSFGWGAGVAYTASASIRLGGEHAITMSYGIPITAYQDSSLLYRLCSTHFLEEKYDELFASLDYGQGRKNVLPVGLDGVTAREIFVTATVSWVYLHEQAHLFQNHGKILWRHIGGQVPFSHMDWLDEAPLAPLDQGREVDWIRHCFELSADYEATTNAAGVLIVRDKGLLTRASLWMYVAAITCQFRHFYGDFREPQDGVATGTHPSPAVRMKFTFNAWINTLWHPEIRKHVPWAKSPQDIQSVMTHAFHVANLYMSICRFDTQEVPQFLVRLYEDTPAFHSYMNGIRERWAVLRPEVTSDYFGSTSDAILPAFA